MTKGTVTLHQLVDMLIREMERHPETANYSVLMGGHPHQPISHGYVRNDKDKEIRLGTIRELPSS